MQACIVKYSQSILITNKMRIKLHQKPALTINRTAFHDDKLVYVAKANNRIHYRSGSSCIAYIGTTRKGAKRIAVSAAAKGEDILYDYGIKNLEFYVITCEKVQGLKSWKMLERALIIRFRELYGEVLQANGTGNKMRWKNEGKYFNTDKLDKIIDEMS